MRKILTVLLLLSLFAGTAGAANVTISKIPTFNWGPAQGMKNVGTIQAEDLYATDDLLVAGDAEVIGTLYVGILNAGANITGKTLAATDADKLTVGGLIVPQTMIINVPIAAASADQNIFIPTDSWEVINVTEVHTVAGNDAGPVNLTIVKCTGTDAPSAGDAMLNAPIDLKGTANTIAAGELLTGSGLCKINDTERLAIDCSGTLTTLAGGVVTIELKRV